MKHPEAIEKLFKLIEIPDRDSTLMKSEDRRLALYRWIEKYLEHIEEKQLILSSKRVTATNHDFICEKIAHDCVDELIDKRMIEFTIAEHSYTAEMWAFKATKGLKYSKKKV
jgi:hypothetical protein